MADVVHSDARLFASPQPLAALLKMFSDGEVERAYFDLDLTLVDTRSFFTELEVLFFRSLGSDHDDLVRELHNRLIHLTGKEIIQGQYRALIDAGQLIDNPEREIYRDFTEFTDRELETNDTMDLPLVQGGERLIATAHAAQTPYTIATNTIEKYARFILRRSPMSQFDCQGSLLSHSQIKHGKATAEFWAHAMKDINPERSMGFEDNPEAGRWMLEHGKIGRAFVLRDPTGEKAKLEEELYSDFKTRVDLLDSWLDLD